MKSVRFGLIGYGAWGMHHAQAIEKTEGAELVAVTARSDASRQKAAADHPGCNVIADYCELLDRPDIDIVDVVLPNYLHYEFGRSVLEAGKHLLLEKPMTVDVDHARQLVTLANEKDRLLAVGFELRVSELWGRTKQLIDEGGIGEPQYVLIELWRRPYRSGAEGWRFDIQRVGNWILEEPIHFFDLARWYFSSVGNPVSVYACANSRQEGHPELRDNFSATLKFPHGSYAVISQTLSAYEHHQTVKVTGTKGAIWASWSGELDRDPHPTSSLTHFDGETIHEIPLTKPTGELFELEDEIAIMVRAVRDGEPLVADGTDGCWSVLLCEAANESVLQGTEVAVSATEQ